MAWFRRKPKDPPATREFTDLLFGDLPASAWIGDATSEPWTLFVEANDCLARDDVRGAADALSRITQMARLESRHYLQAWHGLRALNQPPPLDVAKHVLGVVIEVTVSYGVDVLAAYEDHTARYLNAHGGGVIWERPNSTLDQSIDHLLAAGRAIVTRIGVWTGARRGPPPVDHVRVTLLTPSGPHFGEGPLKILERDPLAGPAVAAGVGLVQHLTQLVSAG